MTDGKALIVLGAISVVVTVTGNEENTVTQFLHIVSELTALFISKNCLRELNILSKSFPLPEQPEELVGALGTPAKTQTALCGCPTRSIAPES